MTTQSSFADVLDGIYDAINTSNTSGSIASYPGTPAAYRIGVYDGPPIDDRSALVEIRVGVTGDNFDEIAVSIEQSWQTMDGQRDELLEIPCVIWVRQGSTDVRTWRRTTSDIYNIVAGLLSGNTFSLPHLFTTEVVALDLREIQASDGAALVLPFTVRVTGYLP